MIFQSSGIFVNITLQTLICRVGVLVFIQGIRMLLVSWGMGHGVNIALGKIGYASPVKWDNASLPCTALHQANASLHSPPLSLTHGTALHWTLLAAFSPLPWIAPYTLHSAQWSGACKDSVYQSLDSIPGFTRQVHGVNLNTKRVVHQSVAGFTSRPSPRVNPLLTRGSQPMQCFININTSYIR